MELTTQPEPQLQPPPASSDEESTDAAQLSSRSSDFNKAPSFVVYQHKQASFLRRCVYAACKNRAFIVQLFLITLMTRISLFLYVVHLPYVSNTFFLRESKNGVLNLWDECARLEAACNHKSNNATLCDEVAQQFVVNATTATADALQAECRHASGRTAEWQSASAAGGLLAGLVLGPILGRLSDAWGRRPLAQWTLVGDVLPALGLLLYAKANISLFLYYSLNIVASIIAPQQATDIAMTSAIADVTEKDDHPELVRTALAGLYLSSLSIAVVIGAPVASVLDAETAIVAGSSIIFIAFVWAMFLPETLSASNRHMLPRSAVAEVLFGRDGTLTAVRLVWSSRQLFGTALAGAFLSYALQGMQVITQQFLVLALGFNVREMSTALGVMGLGVLIWATVGAQLTQRILGVSWGVAVLALLSSAQQVAFSLSVNSLMATLLMLGMFLGATHPILVAYVAGLVSPKMQGQAQGCIQAAGALAGAISSVGGAQAFKAFVARPSASYNAGAEAYWISAGVCALAAPVAAIMLR